VAQINRLTALRVDRTRTPGLYHDGAGLYLQVTAANEGVTKSWLFRFVLDGKERRMGLGSLLNVSLAQARDKAAAARSQVKEGCDPIEQRRATRATSSLARAKAMTFDQCRDAYISSHLPAWRNTKHAWQWGASLKKYVTPIFGGVSVKEVDVALVMKALEPVWSTIPETASRLRGRIEAILDWAKVRGLRSGENPARWRGHLDHLLPRRSKLRKVEHHAALAYSDIGAFMTLLRERDAVAARALEFAILTAGRTGEVLGARWDEIHEDQKTWIVPGARMKIGKEHRVPLSAPAIAVLTAMMTVRQNDYVFPGNRHLSLSNTSMLMLLRRMGRGDLTVHGFRSSFRDWAAERTNYPNEVVEMALAHSISNKVEKSYRRGDLFDKRRRLMDDWANFCNAEQIADSPKVVGMRAKEPTA
jgi:integrase